MSEKRAAAVTPDRLKADAGQPEFLDVESVRAALDRRHRPLLQRASLVARRAPQAVARAGRLLRGGPRPGGGPATGARDLDARLPARLDPDRQARRALRRRPPGDAPSDRGRGAGNLRLGRHRDGRRQPAGRTHACWVADDERVGHRNADHRDRRLRAPRGGEGGVARHHSARAGAAGRRRGPRPRDAAQDHAVQRPSHGSARPRARRRAGSIVSCWRASASRRARSR